MVDAYLFVEGGGDNKRLRTECRRGFRKLLERAGLTGRMPRIVPCGGRSAAYDDFCTAQRASASLAMLLVDAEAKVTATSPWDHVKNRRGDGWDRPGNATNDQLHLIREDLVVLLQQLRPEPVTATATRRGDGSCQHSPAGLGQQGPPPKAATNATLSADEATWGRPCRRRNSNATMPTARVANRGRSRPWAGLEAQAHDPFASSLVGLPAEMPPSPSGGQVSPSQRNALSASMHSARFPSSNVASHLPWQAAVRFMG